MQITDTNGSPIKTEELTKTLSANILMMMAGFFDEHNPAGDVEFSKMIMHGTKLMADGIAEKLTLTLSQKQGTLTAGVWKELVVGATRNAFFEFPDDGPMIKLAGNTSFVTAVEDCTAKTVAPRGSAWARELLRAEEHGLRKYLKSINVPANEIKRLVAEWRCHEAADGNEL